MIIYHLSKSKSKTEINFDVISEKVKISSDIR